MARWNIPDILTLFLYSKLTNAERIHLIEAHETLEDALAAIGAMPPDFSEIHQWVDDCATNDVDIVSYWHTRYPQRLRTIDSPPPILYVWGTLPDNSIPSIAVVGTRTCTALYGKPATDSLVDTWTRNGCAIVSGLANGIDMLAHEACIRSGGRTIAVIASGIGRITPIPAQRLAENIVRHNGAVISEHPFHIAALPPYFPARNRIISGLSDCVVVVESKSAGGALITAEFALQQKRKLWAVPGPINSTRSDGTNALIQSGKATMICKAHDVLHTMGISHQEKTQHYNLPKELEIFGPDPIHIDAIASAWKCTIPEAISRMLQFEFEGIVIQLAGSLFQIRIGG